MVFAVAVAVVVAIASVIVTTRHNGPGKSTPQASLSRSATATVKSVSAGGAIEWTYPTGGFVNSSPAVASGTVYVSSADDRVYALSAGS